jgi:hypothetical protein
LAICSAITDVAVFCDAIGITIGVAIGYAVRFDIAVYCDSIEIAIHYITVVIHCSAILLLFCEVV